MKTISQILLVVVSVLVLSCTYAQRHESGVRGDEIIVKFAADQTVNDTIQRAFDDADAEILLGESVQRLSAELGVPFVYSRFTSGREIVVEIRSGQVYEFIAARIRDSDEVVDTAIEKRAAGGVSSGPDEILVTIDSSKTSGDSDLDADALAARLVGDQRFPVLCDIRADGRLAVTPDFTHLVTALVKELASRADIEYAQPNYQVRHYSDTQ